MLNRVLQLLAAQGWFDTSTPFEKTINLTQGACLWLMLTRNGVSDSYVKFSDRVSLEQEAKRCAAASRCYPTLVPRFVGYVHQDGLDVLVCRAVEFRSLNARLLKRPGVRDRVFTDLNRYFGAMPATRLPPELTPLANAAIGDSLLAYFDPHPLRPLVRRWLDSDAARRAEGLPELPQHGDLVLNNVGQTEDGAVVIFDWEDFGASCLPGLDLFTLELSLAGDAAQLLAGRAKRSNPTQRFVRNACEAMRIDFDDYRQLTPIYALIFRYLKRNYGPGVRERIDRVLTDLEQRQPAVHF